MKVEILGPGPKTMGLRPALWSIQKEMSKVTEGGQFHVASALADLKGVTLLRNQLVSMAENGIDLKFIIGIDLDYSPDAIMRLETYVGSKNVLIYKNPADSTFHPKVWLIKHNSASAFAVIGSSNLTGAGLEDNFEVNLGIHLDLLQKPDVKLFKSLSDFFSGLINQKSIKRASLVRTQLPRSPTKPPRPRGSRKLGKIFRGEPHGWQIVRPSKLPAFVMTLSLNDVSGRRGEGYIRVPVGAVKSNRLFWGWQDLFRVNPAGFPQRKVRIRYRGKLIDSRMYFVPQITEFRVLLPEVYHLGASYQGSLFKLTQDKSDYQAEVFVKGTKAFSKLLPFCTQQAPRGAAPKGKLWGYL